MLITSFRMVDAGPRAAQGSRALFTRVFAEVSSDTSPYGTTECTR
jgi:hypothetical protein